MSAQIVDTPEALSAILGQPSRAVLDKNRNRLHRWDRAWIAASPLLLLSTSDNEGRCDVSPRGDPAGFVHVIDDETVAIPERPGNKRADSLRNILVNPHVGLLLLVPGRDQTLRINGRARIVSDAPYFDDMVIEQHRPALAIVVDIEQIFFHCAKAFLRAGLWQPASWAPERLPTHAQIVKEAEQRPDSLEALETYYGPSYAEKLYR
jgi:uncharacterized protein